MNIAKKFRFQKKYLFFFPIVIILSATSIIHVDCPICEGTGRLEAMPYMENVEIISTESEELYKTAEICEAFIVYKYNLILELKNNGIDGAKGFVKMVLRDYTKGAVMDIQYLSVSIPGRTAVESTYVIYFGTALDVPGRTEVFAEVVTGAIEDQTCEATGKLPLNIALLVNRLTDVFEEKARTVKEYKPPMYYPPDTEGGGWAE
jgi:hypothetical protein